MTVKNSLNASTFPKKYEVNDLASETVPDQTMSMREILTRYSRGLPLGGERVPLYSEDPENDMPDMQHLDLAEQQEIIEQHKDELRNLSHKINEDKRERSKKQKGKVEGGEAKPVYTGEDKPDEAKGGTTEAKGGAKQPDTPANL